MDKGKHILITGSSGLIGTALRLILATKGIVTKGLDIRGCMHDLGDIRNRLDVRHALNSCIGVIHLAAISRVAWCERDPDNCWGTNVEGLSNLIDEIEQCRESPWLIYASSREVYGEPEILPVFEDAPFRPMNVYARSKVEGERLMCAAAARGLRTAIVRLSNVYGSVSDYPDRVVPAFARAAATGGKLKVEGRMNSFDFTHVSDVARGMLALIEMLSEKCDHSLPPLNFVTGKTTTLEQLATLSVQYGNNGASIIDAPPRTFDVSHFRGDPSRAKELLGWEATVQLRDGLRQLVDEFSLHFNCNAHRLPHADN